MRKLFLMLILALLVMVIPAAAQDDEATDIVVWIAFTDGRLDWARERAAEFNELYPEYNVIIEGYGSYNEAFDATLLAAEQGNPPAITHFFEAATQEARDAVTDSGEPLFKSVEAAIAGRTEINGVPVILDDVISAAANYYTLDGEFTSMPWNTSSAIMFTNMDILEAAGIEEIPATWQELEAACEVIMAMESAPEACITWPNHSWFFEQSMAQQGADLANNGNGREARATEVFINSDAAVAYLDWWKRMYDNGYYVYTGVVRDWTGTYNAFIAQQVAFLIYSSSDTTLITNDSQEAGFTAVASFMPHNGEVEYVGNLIGGATLWLNNGLDEETETGALMFMNWFSNPQNAADWHKFTGYVPITNAAIELLEEEGWYEENPNSRVASAQLEAAQPSSATAGALIGNFVAIRDVITSAVEEILLNDVDVVEALNAANEEANQLLSDYNELYGE
ncbi:MAG: ABC transporter substrate-binding protein [Phototrophicales bacterium]|nr:MAG: ABC transporter substrate-binding protein [Phototrophicales bacterium]RMG77040.1 MAG: extracellular solute-binding protein [Chloroflexota bacterium]